MQFLDLRLDDHSAISLAWVLVVVILMVLFGWVELSQFCQLRDYLVFVVGLDFFEDFFCGLEFVFGFVHDDGTVLGP